VIQRKYQEIQNEIKSRKDPTPVCRGQCNSISSRLRNIKVDFLSLLEFFVDIIIMVFYIHKGALAMINRSKLKGYHTTTQLISENK
jgi:hypothetical protein